MAKKKTIGDFKKMKEEKQQVTWVTAYDFPTASFAEQAGIDMILVGDSLGMVVEAVPPEVTKFRQCLNQPMKVFWELTPKERLSILIQLPQICFTWTQGIQ